MQITVTEDKKNRYVFEMKDADIGLCQIIKEELLENSHVKLATVRVKHPLIGSPEILVETDGADGRKVVAEAAQKAKKKAEKFEKEASAEVK